MISIIKWPQITLMVTLLIFFIIFIFLLLSSIWKWADITDITNNIEIKDEKDESE